MAQILDFDSQIGGLEGMDFGCQEEPEKENTNYSKRKVTSKVKTVLLEDIEKNSEELVNYPEDNYDLSMNSPKRASVGQKISISYSSSEYLDENHAETSLNRPQTSKATISTAIGAESESDDADVNGNTSTVIESRASVSIYKTTPVTRKYKNKLLNQQVEAQKVYQKLSNDYQQSIKEIQQKKLEELIKIRRSCQQQEYELKKTSPPKRKTNQNIKRRFN